MSNPRLFLPIAALCALTPLAISMSSAHADTVHLKRGGSLDGEVVEKGDTIEVKLEGGSTTFNRAEIERIEKTESTGRSQSPILRTASGWVSKTSAWGSRMRHQAIARWRGIREDTSGWFQPVGKSAATKAKEKKLNETLLEMQSAQKKLHAKEKAEARAKRDLKKDRFHF